ncbi:MAG: hypothetical protein ACU837_08480 [Gammaproteobacteria bacterium]
MNSIKSPLENWLAEISAETGAFDDIWDPDFEGGLQIVIAKLGPLSKIYRRPPTFVKRFYHRVYPLPIEEWQLNSQAQLYDGFCTIDVMLSIRFQASVKFAQAHIETLPEINRHIKTSYEGLIRDVVAQELRLLEDGEWIEAGLSHVEKRLQTYINETLAVQYILCRTMCRLQTTFTDLADTPQLNSRFAREDIYSKVLKKNLEIRERQEQERFHQEQTLKQQQLLQQQQLIEQQNRENELKRAEQAQVAENRKRLLEEQERQLSEQLQIEERMHREQVLHRQRLQEMEWEAETEARKQQHSKQLQLEQRQQEETLENQRQLHAKQLATEIEEFNQRETTWNQTQERMRMEKIQLEERLKQMETAADLKLQELKFLEEQKLQEQLQEEKRNYESRLKEKELEMEIQEQKKRYEATQEIDEYLRHDIELLILEKHRSELVQAILKSKQSILPPQRLPPSSEEP